MDIEVFRLEIPAVDGVGDGVFACGGAYEYDDNRRQGTPEAYSMPCPMDRQEVGKPLHNYLKGLGRESDYVFGFRSLTQLKKAFSSKRGRKSLDDMGVRVSVYSVDKEKVRMGHTQLIFSPDFAQRVAILSCEDFLQESNRWTGRI